MRLSEMNLKQLENYVDQGQECPQDVIDLYKDFQSQNEEIKKLKNAYKKSVEYSAQSLIENAKMQALIESLQKENRQLRKIVYKSNSTEDFMLTLDEMIIVTHIQEGNSTGDELMDREPIAPGDYRYYESEREDTTKGVEISEETND